MSDRKVKISIAQLRGILAWAERQTEAEDFDVEIEVSHASGIGPTVEAIVHTGPGEGVFKDFTELDKW